MRDVFTPNLGGEYTGPVDPLLDRFAIKITKPECDYLGYLWREDSNSAMYFSIVASVPVSESNPLTRSTMYGALPATANRTSRVS